MLGRYGRCRTKLDRTMSVPKNMRATYEGIILLTNTEILLVDEWIGAGDKALSRRRNDAPPNWSGEQPFLS